MTELELPSGKPTLVARAARGVLGLFGWRVEVLEPVPAKAVIAVYPHTSNWDFVIGIVARAAMQLPLNWMGKDSLFRWPFGALFRSWGGIPVNRRERTGVIAQMQAEFARRPGLLLALAPEGTRSHTDHWRSGFYYMALGARVPVGLGTIDYGRRVVAIGEWMTLTGDVARDLERFRAFYAGRRGLRPAGAGEIRFRDP